jgi:hypothetical protein
MSAESLADRYTARELAEKLTAAVARAEETQRQLITAEGALREIAREGRGRWNEAGCRRIARDAITAINEEVRSALSAGTPAPFGYVEQTREQRNTLERLSLKHGDAECSMYRSRGVRGELLLARFADGHTVTINEDGRTP